MDVAQRETASGFALALDASVLARAQRGDASAFEVVYRSYSRPAFGLALRVLGRPAVAEDVVHDAFLRAFERMDGYRGDAPFGAWIKRLVLNAAIDRLRAERRWAGDAEPVDALREVREDPSPLLDAQGLLARLAPRARAVVWLHEMEGWSHPEIAERFRQSESWSKSVLARSLERLRAQQEDAG
ncbi:RNA polymerase sigma factor [Pseudomarimonas salicorniae]|uniref:RNA polymerase sigma factor n=1 Tax=Pseudomarimonas salicorniae TaxID=2933270 RepID=A0ABT0GJW9_9GAMM|nr:RNA polymerase sigma factor [Lysobacter sp. CAU 1642]MCK7594509.1 RNA polymerase sigma factor [Lysobacter sp. CAU 1642]